MCCCNDARGCLAHRDAGHMGEVGCRARGMSAPRIGPGERWRTEYNDSYIITGEGETRRVAATVWQSQATKYEGEKNMQDRYKKNESTTHELQFVVDFQSIPIRTVKELAYYCVYAATNPFKRPLLMFERSWVLCKRHARDIT